PARARGAGTVDEQGNEGPQHGARQQAGEADEKLPAVGHAGGEIDAHDGQQALQARLHTPTPVNRRMPSLASTSDTPHMASTASACRPTICGTVREMPASSYSPSQTRTGPYCMNWNGSPNSTF